MKHLAPSTLTLTLAFLFAVHPSAALGKNRRTIRPPGARTALVLKAAAARSLPAGLSPASRAALRKVVALLRGGKRAAARVEFKRFSRSYFNSATRKDLTVIIQWLLRESYLAGNQSLRATADKVRSFNELKGSVRRQIRALRKAKSGPAGKPRRWRTLTLQRSGKRTVARPGPWKNGTTQQLDAAIARWEKELNQLGSSGQLAGKNLQNAIQKQQRTVQLLTTISKMLHDTAAATIRNLR